MSSQLEVRAQPNFRPAALLGAGKGSQKNNSKIWDNLNGARRGSDRQTEMKRAALREIVESHSTQYR